MPRFSLYSSVSCLFICSLYSAVFVLAGCSLHSVISCLPSCSLHFACCLLSRFFLYSAFLPSLGFLSTFCCYQYIIISTLLFLIHSSFLNYHVPLSFSQLNILYLFVSTKLVYSTIPCSSLPFCSSLSSEQICTYIPSIRRPLRSSLYFVVICLAALLHPLLLRVYPAVVFILCLSVPSCCFLPLAFRYMLLPARSAVL